MPRLLCVALGVAIALARPSGASLDALASLKLALGGEAALAGITSIHASGKVKTPELAEAGSLNVYLESPDKFVRVMRMPMGLPAGSYQLPNGYVAVGNVDGSLPADASKRDLSVSWTDSRYGFNGRTLLRPRPGDRVSGYEIVQSDAWQQYCRFALPLLGGTSEWYRTDPVSVGDVVMYASPDRTTWSLRLDPATHLPSELAWTQRTQIAPRGMLPADRRWMMTFGDFRKTGAVTWPYRINTTLDGEKLDEIRIGKYEINKKISPKAFKQ